MRLHSSAFLLSNHDVNARRYPLGRWPQSLTNEFAAILRRPFRHAPRLGTKSQSGSGSGARRLVLALITIRLRAPRRSITRRCQHNSRGDDSGDPAHHIVLHRYSFAALWSGPTNQMQRIRVTSQNVRTNASVSRKSQKTFSAAPNNRSYLTYTPTP